MGCIHSTPNAQSPSSLDIHKSKEKIEPKGSIFVDNLPREITASQLQKEFQQFGKITRGKISITPRGGNSCSAYIQFERKSSARKAIKASPLVIFRRRILVEERTASSSKNMM